MTNGIEPGRERGRRAVFLHGAAPRGRATARLPAGRKPRGTSGGRRSRPRRCANFLADVLGAPSTSCSWISRPRAALPGAHQSCCRAPRSPIRGGVSAPAKSRFSKHLARPSGGVRMCGYGFSRRLSARLAAFDLMSAVPSTLGLSSNETLCRSWRCRVRRSRPRTTSPAWFGAPECLGSEGTCLCVVRGPAGRDPCGKS